MKMKKLFVIMVAACVSCALLIGCTSQKAPSFSSFDESFSSFETSISVDATVKLEATVDTVESGNTVQGKTMKRLIVEIPDLGNYTISCLCDETTDELYNVNLTGRGSPYFAKIAGIILEDLSISGDLEQLKESLSSGISEESVTNYAEMGNASFVLVKSGNEYSFSVHPQ